jgi:hypothetical protein
MMGEPDGGYTDAEPAKSIFTKDDLKPWIEDEDPEFDELDNSVACEELVLEEARVDPIDSVEATDRKLISLVQDNIKGPLADKAGSSGFYSENGQRFMAIPVSTNSDAYDFDSYKKELQQVFPNTDIYCVVDDSEIVIDVTSFYTERKSIPEGMTIEQLVEEMEENEDTVECTWCEELFDKSECRKEVNLGWLCSRCEAAIKSRGETLTFKENNYWDFLDEDIEKPVDEELEWHTYKITFTDKANPETEHTTTFKTWQSDVEYAWRMSNANIPHTVVKNIELIEDIRRDPFDHHDPDYDEDEAADCIADQIDNAKDAEYDKSLDTLEEATDYRKHLVLCPECGADQALDTETGICINCGFSL